MILRGEVADVMRLSYAVFHCVVDAVRGILYPPATEISPVPLLYEIGDVPLIIPRMVVVPAPIRRSALSSARMLVKYRFVPSATFVVRRPREEVAKEVMFPD